MGNGKSERGGNPLDVRKRGAIPPFAGAASLLKCRPHVPARKNHAGARIRKRCNDEQTNSGYTTMSDSGVKVLVVGGAGYIGSHAMLDLAQRGFDPIALDDLSSGHRWAVPPERLVVGDIADAVLLDRLFAEHRFEAVLHFASFIQVGESVRKPLAYYRNNVANTVALLAAMERHGVKRFIFSSTAAVYGTPDAAPIPEDATLRQENPYGRSKAMVEAILADCERAWGLESVCLRYFNAAGAHPSAGIGEAHDPETHLIPLVLRVALGTAECINVFGDDYPTADGTCIRDYIHVCDLVDAHVLALQRLLAGSGSDVFNLGNGKGYSVLEVIETCRRITGHSIPAKVAPRRPGDPAILVASAEKAQATLGWRQQFAKLEDIVATAWAWHRKQPSA